MAASADVIEMRAAIKQVLAEFEYSFSKRLAKSGTGGFSRRKRCFWQRSCTDMLFTWWACLDALLSRHTLRWSDWLIWPVNHQHRQMVYPISNQYFRPLPKALQRNNSRWKCWANANHSIWRSQVRENEELLEKKQKTRDHIQSFSCRTSHYARRGAPGRKFLPGDLSFSQMHRMFLEQNHRQASYSLYYSIFIYDFNLAFGHPAKDICSTCVKHRIAINNPDSSPEEKRDKIILHTLHPGETQGASHQGETHPGVRRESGPTGERQGQTDGHQDKHWEQDVQHGSALPYPPPPRLPHRWQIPEGGYLQNGKESFPAGTDETGCRVWCSLSRVGMRGRIQNG